MNNNKKVRLYSIIHNKETVNNLINFYKKLKGKENLNKRIFLKTIVWCSLNPNSIRGDEEWIEPEKYFHPLNLRSILGGFDMNKFDNLWNAHSYDTSFFTFYNHQTHKVLGKLI